MLEDEYGVVARMTDEGSEAPSVQQAEVGGVQNRTMASVPML